jgi:hypothetical protein
MILRTNNINHLVVIMETKGNRKGSDHGEINEFFSSAHRLEF